MHTYRPVDRIHAAPRPHWVGDGFLVHPMFSHMQGTKRTDPFLMLDYAAPRVFSPNPSGSPRGVGQHPHKGFETVTIAYQGEVAHRDSSGGGGVIGEGDVQWMTAGRGVIHEEFHSPAFAARGGPFEMVQLWVNLPARHKGVPARYQHLADADIPVVKLGDGDGTDCGQVRLIAGVWPEGQTGVAGPGQTFTPIHLWDVQVQAGQAVELPVPRTHNLLVLVMRGQVSLNADPAQVAGAQQLVTFAAEPGGAGLDWLRLQAGAEAAQLLLMSGEPIGEPVVGYGPFVMNSEQEIRQAIHEFNAGRFGRID